jgi:hypothetical protein
MAKKFETREGSDGIHGLSIDQLATVNRSEQNLQERRGFESPAMAK